MMSKALSDQLYRKNRKALSAATSLMMANNGSLSRQDLIDKLGFSPSKALNTIQTLILLGLIQPTTDQP